MIKELTAAADDTGAFFVNVTSGRYGVGLNPEFGVSREYLAALLNSELLSSQSSGRAQSGSGMSSGVTVAASSRVRSRLS